MSPGLCRVFSGLDDLSSLEFLADIDSSDTGPESLEFEETWLKNECSDILQQLIESEEEENRKCGKKRSLEIADELLEEAKRAKFVEDQLTLMTYERDLWRYTALRLGSKEETLTRDTQDRWDEIFKN